MSANLLKEQHVQVIDLEGRSVIRIHVPRAPRKSRPVYIGGNPMTGTYKRQNSGDYRCDDESVRRMLAEQVEDSRDNEILHDYGLEDIDTESFNAYRHLYAARAPDHPWSQSDPLTFLRNIGAWRIDREVGKGGLTRAGLLMFGSLPSIQEAFPNYMLDYQERPEAKAEARWVDRLTLDGSWSGGTVYHLPGQNLPTPDQAFGEGDAMSGAQFLPSAPSSGHNATSSGHNDRLQSNSTRHEDGYLMVKGLNKPLIDNLKLLPEALRQELMSVAEKARAKQRLAPDEMTPILLRLCENAYLTQQVLAELVNRMPEALRKNNLKPLVDKGSLALAFPTVPTHPQQAYTSNKGRGDD